MKSMLLATVLAAAPSIVLADANCGQPITTVYSRTMNQPNASGIGGWSYREPVTLTGAGDTLRVTVIGASGAATKFTHVALGFQASGANTVATPIEALFGGASGVTVAAGVGNVAASDWFTAPAAFTSGQAAIVVGDYDATAMETDFALGSGTNTYYKAATSSYNQASPIGFTSNPNYFVVAKIEAMTCGAAPPPVAGATAAILSAIVPSAPSQDLLGATTPTLPAVDASCDASYSLVRSRAHVKWQPTLQRVGGSIALIGDSIVEYMVQSQVSPWAANYGVKADTLPCMMNRIAASGDAPGVPLSSLHSAFAVFVLFGTNDAAVSGRTATATAAFYQTLQNWILGASTAPAGKVLILGSALPNSTSSVNSFAVSLNALTKPICQGVSQCTYVDFWPVLAPGGTQDSSKFLDGVHPNDDGFKLMYPLIRGALAVPK